MAFALMLHFVRATPTRLAKNRFGIGSSSPTKKRSCCYSFMCFRRFDAFFSEIVSKVSGITKSARIRSLSKKSFISH